MSTKKSKKARRPTTKPATKPSKKMAPAGEMSDSDLDDVSGGLLATTTTTDSLGAYTPLLASAKLTDTDTWYKK